jgi:hypothetical protein
MSALMLGVQLVFFSLSPFSVALAEPEPIIAVIDRLHERWVSLVSERGVSFDVPRANSEGSLREGQWVLYLPQRRRITPIKSRALKARLSGLERDLTARLQRLITLGRGHPEP